MWLDALGLLGEPRVLANFTVYCVTGNRSFHLTLKTKEHVLALRLLFPYSGLPAAVVQVMTSDELVSKQMTHNFIAQNFSLMLES